MASGKKSVMFLCTGNSARSQMAEAFLRSYAGDRFEVYSSGLKPQGINPYTVRVMEEKGYDLSSHTSDAVKDFLGKAHFSYAIAVCDKANEHCPRLFPSALKCLHWSFEDPAAFKDSEKDVFREVPRGPRPN